MDISGLIIWITCTFISCTEWVGELSQGNRQNLYPILLTVLGRSLVIVGMLIYIFYIVFKTSTRILEYVAMLMITVGPILNAVACHFFVTNVDGYKFTWMAGSNVL